MRDLTKQKQAQEWFKQKMKQAGFLRDEDLAEYLGTSRATISVIKNDPAPNLAAKFSPDYRFEELKTLIHALRITKEELVELLPDHAALFPNTGLERPRTKQHALKSYKNPKKQSTLIPLTESIGTFDVLIAAPDIHPNLKKGEVVRLAPNLADTLEPTMSYAYSTNGKDLEIGQYLYTISKNRIVLYNYQEKESVEVQAGDIVGGIVKISQI